MAQADSINEYIAESEPWKLNKDPRKKQEVQEICSLGINLFRILMIYLKPILPKTAKASEIFLNDELNWSGITEPLKNHHIETFLPMLKRIDKKSIKIEFPRLSVSASFFTSIFDRFLLPTSTHWISENLIFLKEKQSFFKKRLSMITSISASILVPTCLHVGLQNRRFSEIMAFQEAFKISSFLGIDFFSILGPSWPPTWPRNRKNGCPNGVLKPTLT